MENSEFIGKFFDPDKNPAGFEEVVFEREKHLSKLRKRLKHSMRNTVPFYLYSNKKVLSSEMKAELKNILFDIFE